MSHAIGMLKPDCIRQNLQGTVYAMIERSGLRIIYKKRKFLSRDVVTLLYGKWKKEPFYDRLVEYMVSGQVEIFLVEGNGAITKLLQVIGGHNGQSTGPDTIRGKYATSMTENVIHSSNCYEEFIEESKILLDDVSEKIYSDSN